MKGSRVITFGC